MLKINTGASLLAADCSGIFLIVGFLFALACTLNVRGVTISLFSHKSLLVKRSVYFNVDTFTIICAIIKVARFS